MLYELKNCRNGEKANYRTTVDISESCGKLTFVFTAEHTSYYCPHHNYNDIHSEGDACEILIGSDPERKVYYEIEISPENKLMLAEMVYGGVEDNGEPILEIHFIKDCFLESEVTKTESGYVAKLSFERSKILSGNGKVYFNAYRLETDGGERDKHLFALVPTMRPKFHAPSYFVFLDEYLK